MSDERRTPPTTDEIAAMIAQRNADKPPYIEPDFAAARSFDEWLALRTLQADHQPTSSPGCTWKCDAYGHDDECLRDAWNAAIAVAAPIPLILHCPKCHLQHVDVDDETGAWATARHHRKHLCKPSDGGCSHVWRAANVFTVGVKELPAEVSD